MARRDDDSQDIEKLLADVDRTLGRTPAGSGGARAQPARRSRGAGDDAPRRRGGAAIERATTTGAAAAVVVAIVFYLMPFIGLYGAACGAAGAFIAAFVTSLLPRRR